MVETWSYLSSPYHEGYKVQMDFYAFLLKEMNFEVDETSYFLVCNADRTVAFASFFGGAVTRQHQTKLENQCCC